MESLVCLTPWNSALLLYLPLASVAAFLIFSFICLSPVLLGFSKCSINICWINEWMNVISYIQEKAEKRWKQSFCIVLSKQPKNVTSPSIDKDIVYAINLFSHFFILFILKVNANTISSLKPLYIPLDLILLIFLVGM